MSVPDVSGREEEYLRDCIQTGWVSSLGSYVERFERDFATLTRHDFGVSVNSGTAAIHLALRALDVGPQHEVILPALTFASSANCVLYQGARPVFADCRADDWNIDPADLESLITDRTAAIMPVHLYGAPCAMDEIMAIAARHNVPVVEDCAEAHGATYHDEPVGGFGRVGCFSFYGNKILTTGEGGMCVTSDAALDERLRVLRDHGMNKQRRYWHDEVGYNYRMTNLQAAVGCAQLERLDEFVARRRWIAEQYRQRLEGTELVLPRELPETVNVYWLYTAILPERYTESDRDAAIAHLDADAVESRPFFYSLPRMPPYREFARPLPHSERMATRGITLPSYFALGEAEIDRVTDSLIRWLDRP